MAGAKLVHLFALYVSLFGVALAQMDVDTTMAIPRVILTPVEAPANALPSTASPSPSPSHTHTHTHTHIPAAGHTHVSSAMTTPAPVKANANVNENVNANSGSTASGNDTMTTASSGGNSSTAPATAIPTVNAARRPSQPRLGKLTLVVGLVTYGLIML